MLVSFFHTVGDRAAAQLPLGQERFTLAEHGLGCAGVHHLVELGLDLVVQMFGGVGEQVALLMNRAALDRDVIPEARQYPCRHPQ